MSRLSPPGTHGRPLIVVDARRLMPRCPTCHSANVMLFSRNQGDPIYQCLNHHCGLYKSRWEGFFTDAELIEGLTHEQG